jgi:hypothetical protein
LRFLLELSNCGDDFFDLINGSPDNTKTNDMFS